MDIPHMTDGEALLLEMPDVHVKSRKFRLFLTNFRILLADTKNPSSSPVEVPLDIIRDTSPHDGPDGSADIIISLLSPEGKVRKMIISLLPGAGGVRTGERDRITAAITEAAPPKKEAVSVAPPVSPPASASERQTPGAELKVAENIIVKSREFRVVLRDDAILLTVDGKGDAGAAPVEIPLKSLISAEPENTVTGEPTLILSISAGEGAVKKMILTFSEWYTGNRRSERDSWVNTINDLVTCGGSVRHVPGILYGTTFRESGSSKVNSEVSLLKVPGEVITCPACGQELPPGFSFCHACGASLDRGEKAAAATIPEEPLIYPGAAEKDAKKRAKQERKREKLELKQKKAGDGGFFKFLCKGSKNSPNIENLSLTDRFFGLLFVPKKVFRFSKVNSARDALLYFLLVVLIYVTVQMAVFAMLSQSMDAAEYPVITSAFSGATGILIFSIESFILVLIVILAEALLLHLGVLIAGGRHGVLETTKTCMYASTPLAFAGLIPVFGPVIAPVWVFALQIIGIREEQELSTGRAFFAVIFPVIIIIAILLIMAIVGHVDIGFIGNGTAGATI
ncbi:MAG: YIP1 family protein [Methanogenium sp.]|nr:YIP1 family protein [Methanogenium sp.]